MPDNHFPHVHIPIGTIKESTEDRTTVRLIPPHPNENKLYPQATILTRDPSTGAHAKAVVRVVETQGNLARFEILELETEPEWPEGADPLATGKPVYLAMPGTFEPDPHAQGTDAEIQAHLEKTHRQGHGPAENLQESNEQI